MLYPFRNSCYTIQKTYFLVCFQPNYLSGEGFSWLSEQDVSIFFCFFGLLWLSSSMAFSLFFIAAIFALRLICPQPERLDLLPPTTLLEKVANPSKGHFSLARRTTRGRPQAILPCIFSLACIASCMLTLKVGIRKLLQSEETNKRVLLTSLELNWMKA